MVLAVEHLYVRRNDLQIPLKIKRLKVGMIMPYQDHNDIPSLIQVITLSLRSAFQNIITTKVDITPTNISCRLYLQGQRWSISSS
jgi:hypothetical protein